VVFGETGFRRQLVQAYLSAEARTENIHGAGKTFVKFDAGGHPDRRQIAYHLGDVAVLLQMMREQGRQLLFKPELVKSCCLIRIQDRPDQGVEDRIPAMQLVKEKQGGQLFFRARIQNPVCRSYQGIEDRFAEEIPEMDIKSFGTAGIFRYLQGIQLGTIADKIAVRINAGRLPVYAAKTMSPYIQKKGDRALDIGTETFPDLCMNNNTGETCRIQRQVTPSQAIAKFVGNLAFQPGNIGKFLEDH